MNAADERDSSSAMERESVGSGGDDLLVGNQDPNPEHRSESVRQRQRQRGEEEPSSEWIAMARMGPFSVAEPVPPGGTMTLRCSAVREDERHLVRFDPPGGLVFAHHNQTETEFIDFYVLRGEVDPNDLPGVSCEVEHEDPKPEHDSDGRRQRRDDDDGVHDDDNDDDKSLPRGWIPGGRLGPFAVAEPVSPGSATIIRCSVVREHRAADLVRFDPPGGLVFTHRNQTNRGFIDFYVNSEEVDPRNMPEVSCTTVEAGKNEFDAGEPSDGNRHHQGASSSSGDGYRQRHGADKTYRRPYGGRSSRMRRSWEPDEGLNRSQLGFLLLILSAGLYHLYTRHVVPRMVAARKSKTAAAAGTSSCGDIGDISGGSSNKTPQSRKRNQNPRGGKGSSKARHKSGGGGGGGKKQGRSGAAAAGAVRSRSSRRNNRTATEQRAPLSVTTDDDDDDEANRTTDTADTAATTTTDEIVGLNVVGSSDSTHSCDVSSVLSVDDTVTTAGGRSSSKQHGHGGGKRSGGNRGKPAARVAEVIGDPTGLATGSDARNPRAETTARSAAAAATARAKNGGGGVGDEDGTQPPEKTRGDGEEVRSASAEKEKHAVEISADDKERAPAQITPKEEEEEERVVEKSADNEKLTPVQSTAAKGEEEKRTRELSKDTEKIETIQYAKTDEGSMATEKTMREEVDTVDTSDLVTSTASNNETVTEQDQDIRRVPESSPIAETNEEQPPAIEGAVVDAEEEAGTKKVSPRRKDDPTPTATGRASTGATDAVSSSASTSSSSSSSSTGKVRNVIVLQIEGMTCGGCVKVVNRVLNSFDEVDSAATDLASCTSTLVCNARRLNLLPILTALDDVGMEAYLLSQSVVAAAPPPAAPVPVDSKSGGRDAIPAAAAIAPPPGIPLPVGESESISGTVSRCPLLMERMKRTSVGAIGRPLVVASSPSPIGSTTTTTEQPTNPLSLMDELRVGSTPVRRYACSCGSRGCICSNRQVHEDDTGTDVSLTDLCNRLETTLGTTKLEETFRETGGSQELRDKILRLSFPCGCSEGHE